MTTAGKEKGSDRWSPNSSSEEREQLIQIDPIEKEEMNLAHTGLQKGWSGHYNPNDLASFKTFTYLSGTVFFDRGIWMVCAVLVVIAVAVALAVAFLTPKHTRIRTGEFETIVKYLKVFLAFMLGMFMNNSLQRWWQTVNTLTDYFNNIEKLIFCANSFSVQRLGNGREELCRLCVLSCEMLRAEMLCLWADPEEVRSEWTATFNRLQKDLYLKENERSCLCQIRPADRSISPWSWIAVLLADLFENKGLKPAAMNRMVVQCQIAVDLASQLRVQLSVQMPFMYAHMMSLLVYCNNVLVAIVCGLSLGSAFKTIMVAVEIGNFDNTASGLQEIFVSMVTLFVEPMLYQAFLQIGTNFCYPFGKTRDHVPVHRMISDLKANIKQMNFLVGGPRAPAQIISPRLLRKRNKKRDDSSDDDSMMSDDDEVEDQDVDV